MFEKEIILKEALAATCFFQGSVDGKLAANPSMLDYWRFAGGQESCAPDEGRSCLQPVHFTARASGAPFMLSTSSALRKKAIHADSAY